MDEWVLVKADGKIISVSPDFGFLKSYLDDMGEEDSPPPREIDVRRYSSEELLSMSDSVKWEDFDIHGTPFRLSVWKAVFSITHGPGGLVPPRLVSYSELAASIGKGEKACRTVATAVGENPLAVLIPCHLVIPLDSKGRVDEKVSNIFRWKGLYMMDKYIDYGEYRYGRDRKRELIRLHMAR